ncbi:DUF262 domain-containing HNH endonuclease family protein [Mycoplasma capricolum subsp. capricolum]|uniref:DUF262 domain-containing protein n=1 Tax=Mycoplasma capricolum TaxID=2095 RepID=UPI003DA4FE14
MESKNDFKVDKKNLRDFFNTRFSLEIPLYQRDYSWLEDNIKTLLIDLDNRYEENKNNNSNEHFFGLLAINVKITKNNDNVYRIIDGQQRLITSLILIHFIQSKINKKRKLDINPIKHLFPYIKITYEFKSKVEQDINTLLNSTSKDNRICEKLNQENVKKAYETIENFFNEKESGTFLFGDILDIFLNNFIFCILEYQTDPRNEMTIFENLNSKGKLLSDLDLIKNFIILHNTYGIDPDKKWALFESEIIGLFKNGKWKRATESDYEKYVTEFLNSFLQFKNFKKTKEHYSLFKNFKKYVLSEVQITNKNEYINFINELRKFLILYLSLKIPQQPDDIGNNEWFASLKSKDIHYPLVFYLFESKSNFDNNKNEWELNNEIIKYMKVFSTHIIKLIATQGTGKSLLPLTEWFVDSIRQKNRSPKEIKRILGNINWAEEEKVPFGSTPIKEQFLSFCSNLTSNEWISYSLIFIIQKTLEKKSNEDISSKGFISLEHIMPQKLNDKWKKDLKEDDLTEDEILKLHKKYVDQIGNLIFISGKTNSELQNAVFSKKVEKYKESKWKLIVGNDLGKLEKQGVYPICSEKYEKWNFDIIDKRTKILAEYVYNIMEDLDNV